VIVGSIHLYSTRRTGPFGQTKDTEDLVRVDLTADTPIEVLRSLRVLLATLEEQMTEQEERKKDNPAQTKTLKRREGLTGRQLRSHLIEDEWEDEDEDETPAGKPTSS